MLRTFQHLNTREEHNWSKALTPHEQEATAFCCPKDNTNPKSISQGYQLVREYIPEQRGEEGVGKAEVFVSCLNRTGTVSTLDTFSEREEKLA